MNYTNWLDYLNFYSYYPNPYFWGTLLFFLVPILLWFIGTAFIPRPKIAAKILVFIAGKDNRLSLSRLQAFAWTLVIFGSFVAAMTIHSKILPTTNDEMIGLKSDAEKATKEETHYQNELDKAWAAFDKTPDETTKAAKDKAEQIYDEKHLAARQAVIRLGSNNWVVIPGALLLLAGIAVGSGIFSSIISQINDEEKTACVTSIEHLPKDEFSNKTVFPKTASTESDNLLKINGVGMDTTGKVRLGRGRRSVFLPILYWQSDGTTIVVDVPATTTVYDTLIVDTPNGKLCYKLDDKKEMDLIRARAAAAKANEKKRIKDEELIAAKKNLEKLTADIKAAVNDVQAARDDVTRAQGAVDTEAGIVATKNQAVADIEKWLPDLRRLSVGTAVYYYEFSDLFRDDKNPSNMDLMKFQMFGWTVVAIVIYAWLFLNNLGNSINSLPLVPDSIVILTGLSQTGYLAGKGVSNIKPNQPAGS